MRHGEAADIAALLLPLIDGAHVTQRLRTGGGQGHARSGVFVDRPLEVVLEFLGELLFDDLLHLPEPIAKHPPPTEEESRAIIYYRLIDAAEDLRLQNKDKAARIRESQSWFLLALVLVGGAVAIYILFSYPP